MLTRRDVIAFALACLVTLPLVTTRLYASDEIQYFAWLRSVTFDRDVDFENEYQHFYASGVAGNNLFHETFLERTNEIGRRINFAPVGCAVLWAPFYGLGHLTALATGAPADGYSQPYISAVTYGSAVYGLLAVLLSAAIARRLVGRGVGASLVVLIATPLLFYVYVAPGFAHADSAFAVALFLWLWLRARQAWRPRDVILLGLVGGVMSMVREQDLFFAAGPAIDFLRWSWKSGRAEAAIRSAAAGATAFLVAFTPQLWAYKVLNGHFGPTELSTRKMTWTSPHALGVLLSPEHGLFAWTPLLLVAVAGLAWLAVQRDADEPATEVAWIARLGLLMLALQVYVSGSVESWTVAGAFGQRRFVANTALFTLGLAAVLKAARQTRATRLAVTGIVVLGIWWNLGLMAQFGANRMDRQRLTLAENAWTTFVELPVEAPSLVWRYLTDRSSFYGSRDR